MIKSNFIKAAEFSILLLCFFNVDLSAQLADSAWPMFGQNPQHTGRGTAINSASSLVMWKYKTGSRVSSSPAIGTDGTVYVGCEDSCLYAIKSEGTLKWKFKTGYYIDYSSPAIGSDGTVYVGSRDNYLNAIKSDGTLKWKYKTGSSIDSSPVIGTDGTVYVGSFDNNLYAIKSDGTLKWVFQTGNDVHSSPAIWADGTVYVGSDDNNIYAIKSNGTLKWKYQTGSAVRSSPAIGEDGTVYVGSHDKNLYAIKSDGTLKWKYYTGGSFYSLPAIGGDGTVCIGSYDSYIYAIKSDGTLKWKFKTGLYVHSSPAIGADGTVYVGSRDSYIYAIKSDGTLKWKYDTDGEVFSSSAIGTDGTMYVGSQDNYLYAFAPDGAHVKISSPYSGEFLIIGESFNISWEFIDIINVKLEYSTDNGMSWTTITESTEAANRSYLWKVPNSPSTQCIIRLSDTSNPKVNDVCNGVFTIGRSEPKVIDVPSEYPSIQKAIDAAAPGDTVLVSPGTYYENINFNGKRNIVVGSFFVTTRDTSYISKTIIDANKKGRVVEFSNREDLTTVLSGFTLTNGFIGEGAAILCFNSSPIIDGVIIENNTVPFGTGTYSGICVYFKNSNAHIKNSKIRRNNGTDLANYNSSSIITDVTIEGGNYFGIGCSNNSNPIITRVTIGNLEGFGISCDDSNPVIQDVEIRNIIQVQGIYDGAGIYCNNSSPIVRNSIIHNIGSPISQGAIYCANNSNPMMENVLIYNVSGDSPKSIYCDSSAPTFINSTITHPITYVNHPNSYGIYSLNQSNPVFTNSIVTDHSYGVYCNSGNVSMSYSNIWNNKLGNFFGASDSLGVPVQVNAKGDPCDKFLNISLDPQFTNGYHLSANSPCIGAGISKDAPMFDIEGNLRHNPPDIGAYEFQRPSLIDYTVPARFALLANHPNPFNSSTVISFTLPKTGNSMLAIYSVTGQRVRTLVSGNQTAGTHSVVWDGRDDSGKTVSSGVYLSRLQMGDKVAVGRMLLLK